MGGVLKKYKGVSERVVIPNSVKVIGQKAFKNKNTITGIVIPDSVTEIGDDAFWWCTELSEINLPNKLKTIGTGVFTECKKIKSIVIPKSVEDVGFSIFPHGGDMVIYCEAESQPAGWDRAWNKRGFIFGGRHKVVWGYKGK